MISEAASVHRARSPWPPRRRFRWRLRSATTASAPRRRCCDTSPTAAADSPASPGKIGELGRQRVDAGLDLQQRAAGESPRIVAEQLLLAVDQHLGQADQLVQQPLRGLVGKRAAAVRRADGDHAADRRIGLERRTSRCSFSRTSGSALI